MKKDSPLFIFLYFVSLNFSSHTKMGLLPLLLGDYSRLIHLAPKFFMMFSVNYFTDEIYLTVREQPKFSFS